ncbi:MAG: RibD family protein, partial [Anaerolineales bacterium]
LTHRLRAAHDAVLVGIGTVLADDPQLTVRLASGPSPRPVVLDSRLRTPSAARLLHHPQPAWIAGLAASNGDRAAVLRQAGAEILELPADSQGMVSLTAFLQEARRRGILRLMVEGGARVIRSFLTARLVDWTLITIAPRFVGGLPALQLDPAEAERGPRLHNPCWQTLGEDLIVWGGLS